ncbi:hypothetical protein PACTADRAFT_32663 [Pachysolen tannophilus NRRL Y-2460]|uniref:Inner centromere protein ARK-binding domain-containing protein n=1 Tax=Pachysolen tannophilus NRRL Y-2460 TaxID=669874 RepID=A0A1E4TZL4_PACTA|nr:hypothetical protein PACTADRAFT_32663 [Pachysolen tannophilus NRRL Y-2460]
MLNTSNFWGLTASKKPNNVVPGTSKWVVSEMNVANTMVAHHSKQFAFSVSAELAWLNEQMNEVVNSDESASVLLLLKSPKRLNTKDSPVRKIRNEAIKESKSPLKDITDNINKTNMKSSPTKININIEKPPTPIFTISKDDKDIDQDLTNDKKRLERQRIIDQVEKIIPKSTKILEHENNDLLIPKLAPLNKEISISPPKETTRDENIRKQKNQSPNPRITKELSTATSVNGKRRSTFSDINTSIQIEKSFENIKQNQPTIQLNFQNGHSPSDDSVLLRKAENFEPISYIPPKENHKNITAPEAENNYNHNDNNDNDCNNNNDNDHANHPVYDTSMDESFQAITKTIKFKQTNGNSNTDSFTVVHEPESGPSVITNYPKTNSADLYNKEDKNLDIEGNGSKKLPSITPITEKFSGFASLPSKEPLTVKSSTKSSSNTSRTREIEKLVKLDTSAKIELAPKLVAAKSDSPKISPQSLKPKSLYPQLHKNTTTLKSLSNTISKEHKDESSPFRVARQNSDNDWVAKSPSKSPIDSFSSKPQSDSSKIELQNSISPAKSGALNSIFANAIKRAKNLIYSPKKQKVDIKESSNKSDQVPPKPILRPPTANSIQRSTSRGNLLTRLTADTESSAARNVKKSTVRHQSSRNDNFQEESPLTKKYTESRTAVTLNPLNTNLRPIPKQPVFTVSSTLSTASTSARRTTSSKSPNMELDSVKKANVVHLTENDVPSKLVLPLRKSSSGMDLSKNKFKAKESLTSSSLNKHASKTSTTTSIAPHYRINKKMAEERQRLEELRRQRLSNPHKMISIDEQLKQPLNRAREKSMKSSEHANRQSSINNSLKRKQQVIDYHHHDAQLTTAENNSAHESSVKRLKTEEGKGLGQKATRVSGARKEQTAVGASYQQKNIQQPQTLMKTAMLQHARLNQTSSIPQVDAIKFSSEKIKFNNDIVSKPMNITSTTPASRRVIASSTTPSKSPIALPEIYSESEDDEEGTVLKSWANSPGLKQALLNQQNINPDSIFGPVAPLNMEEIFKNSRLSKFRARSSSAQWGVQDMLNQQEIEDYSKKMGWRLQ